MTSPGLDSAAGAGAGAGAGAAPDAVTGSGAAVTEVGDSEGPETEVLSED